MASVWRAAFRSSNDPYALTNNQNDADTNDSNKHERSPQKPSEGNEQRKDSPTPSPSPSPSPSSASEPPETTPVPAPAPQAASSPSYRVSIHKLCESSCDESEASTREEDDDTTARHESRCAFVDVLLQSDARGFGLNLALRPTALARDAADDAMAVVVTSFRRCDSNDVGPAEATQQIRVGDVLLTIDGQRVATLADVQQRLSAVASRNGFVLFRFMRDASECALATAAPIGVAYKALASESCPPRELSPAAALLIRELVTKNQVLEEQLMSSRLKQDEQRIQLEQLYALYARTQLESSSVSAFSMPRPLFRPSFPKPPLAVFSPKVSAATDPLSSPPAQRSKSSTASSNLPTSHDIELVVQAERERVTRHWEQRLARVTEQLRAEHEAELQEIRVAMDKKVAMLESGVMRLLEIVTESSSSSAKPVGADVDLDGDKTPGALLSLSPHVQLLRHRLLHQNNRASGHDDCVLCLLQDPLQKLLEERNDQHLRKQILAVLNEQQTQTQTQRSLTSAQPADTST